MDFIPTHEVILAMPLRHDTYSANPNLKGEDGLLLTLTLTLILNRRRTGLFAARNARDFVKAMAR